MKINKRIRLCIILVSLFFLLGITGCVQEPVIVEENGNTTSNIIDTDFEYELFNQSLEIKNFTSETQLSEYLKKNSQSGSFYYSDDFATFGTFEGDVVFEASAQADSSVSAKSIESVRADDYSQTNIQVEGVDEADFVKNDGKYIYMILQGKLVIVDAYPPKEAKIISKTEIKGNPQNLYINKDRVIVFASDYKKVQKISRYDFIPKETSERHTIAYIYNVSDRKNPKLLKEYSATGNYLESRMIEDYIYFISKESIYYYDDVITFPEVRLDGNLISTPEVFYFDIPESRYIFHTFTTFNIYEDKKSNAKTFMLGASNNVYVSQDNIYITHKKTYPSLFYKQLEIDKFFKAVVPLLPTQVADNISEIRRGLEDNSIESYNAIWNEISVVLEDMYNSMEKDEKYELIDKIEESLIEYETEIEDKISSSVVHKISINEDEIEYLTNGEVKGTLLNQFSMDEKDGNLRVATTTNSFSRQRGRVMYNNVYVLDEDLEIIGKIEKIAPDERIYSTRFMGDKLYMVTFKQIDPLFTIDLSNPEEPKIIGQLKIPGFSNYLHPYDENHLIGIGQDTYVNDRGGVRTKGVKISLFDVSDFENPREVDNVIIGDEGSYSEVLNDHKALLFSREKNLLVLPIREVSDNYKTDRGGYFRNRVWNGAYVFTVTPDGFSERGKIKHSDKEYDTYYWSSPSSVRRALYLDDNLYTISDEYIKINDLNTIDEIGDIKLPYNDRWYYDYWYK